MVRTSAYDRRGLEGGMCWWGCLVGRGAAVSRAGTAAGKVPTTALPIYQMVLKSQEHKE